MTMSNSKKRITVQTVAGEGIRITALCGSNMAETRLLIGTKLGFPNPSACKLFNKHGAEIDHVDLVLHDDFLYASAGEPFVPRSSPSARDSVGSNGAFPLSTLPIGGVASTITPFAASTIAADGESTVEAKGDHFDIGKVLGTGGQGTTYLATDRRTGAQAVLKQIFCAGLAETNKAIEEAMMLSRLKHNRVVTYNEVFLGKDPIKGNYVGIVMEYCSGGDLYQTLCKQRAKKKPISVRRVKMWIVQLCEALKYLHMMRVIHRDVKPMNVLIDAAGELKMADFGLARQGVSPSKLAMTQCGTPGYESPEVQMGQGYDFKTDVWGLGCVVCDMTTLRFMHERPGSLATQVQVDPKSILRVIQPVKQLYGNDLYDLVFAMLHSDPRRRPSAAEILEMPFLQPQELDPNAPAPDDSPAAGRAPPSGSPPPVGASPSPAAAAAAGRPQSSGGKTATTVQAGSSGAQTPPAGSEHADTPIGRMTPDPPSRRPDPAVMAAAAGGRSGAQQPRLESSAEGRQRSAPRDDAPLVGGSPGAAVGAEVLLRASPHAAASPAGVAAGVNQAGASSCEGSHRERPRERAAPPADESGSSGLVRGGEAGGGGAGDVMVVSKRPGRDQYGSISQALRAAAAGAVIEVLPGKYQEDLVLDKDVTLRAGRAGGAAGGNGAEAAGGAGVVEVQGTSSRPVLASTARAAVVRGLSLLHVSQVSSEGRECTRCVDVAAGRLRLEECDVTSVCGVGVVVRDSARLEARACRVHRCGQNGVFLFGRGGAVVQDCDIAENQFPGIGMDQSHDTVVSRCRIRGGKGDGVKIYGGYGIVLEGNDICNNAQVGVSIEDGADPVIRNNSIHDGNSCGVSVLNGGKGRIEANDIYSNAHPNVYVCSGSDPVVRGNQIHHSSSCGVTCVEDGLGTIEDNDIFSNQSVGVYIMSRANPLIRNNTIRDGEGDGVAVVFGGRGTIEGNRIEGNAGSGILVESEAEPRIVRNKISDAASDGIRVCHNGKGLVESNSVTGAGRGSKGGSGIVLTTGSAPVVRNNAVRECETYGVLVTEEAAGLVERNTVLQCGSHGIVVARRSCPVVRGNVVRDCGGSGIWVCQAGRGTVAENRLQANRGQVQLQVDAGCDVTLRDNILV